MTGGEWRGGESGTPGKIARETASKPIQDILYRKYNNTKRAHNGRLTTLFQRTNKLSTLYQYTNQCTTWSKYDWYYHDNDLWCQWGFINQGLNQQTYSFSQSSRAAKPADQLLSLVEPSNQICPGLACSSFGSWTIPHSAKCSFSPMWSTLRSNVYSSDLFYCHLFNTKKEIISGTISINWLI
jgi:hypothetical protein